MKRIAFLIACAALGACAAAPQQRSAASGSRARPVRIVSLVPSLTEDLCAIGAAKQLVAVSQFSGDIPCAKALPQVNDAATVDVEKIVALRADLVVGIPSQRRQLTQLRRAHIPVALMRDDSYADIFADIAQLGHLSGHSGEAAALAAKLRAQTSRLVRQEHFSRRPAVFVVVQTAPIWTVGPQSYIATLLSLAGARDAVSALPQPYAQYSAEALLRLQPDALLATADAQLPQVLAREPWSSLRAIREKHLMIAPAAAVLYRPGPRYNEALQWLIEHLRPVAQ